MSKKRTQDDEELCVHEYTPKISNEAAILQRSNDRYVIYFRPSDVTVKKEDIESILQAACGGDLCIGYSLNLFYKGVVAIYFNPLIQASHAKEHLAKKILDIIVKNRAQVLLEEQEEERRYEHIMQALNQENIDIMSKIIPMPL